MVTAQDYEDLARQVEYIFGLITDVNATANTLMVPIPQRFAIAVAEFGTVYPRQIREVGARRAGTWVDTARHDEPEEGS